MTLAEWRKKLDLSVREAARRISEQGGGGITHEGLRLLEEGARSPTIRTADLIRRGTGGAVTRMDWPEETPEGQKKGRES